MHNIIVIGRAGGSGSGKTTLADKIIEHFGDDIAIVHHDNYYRGYKDLSYEERSKINFDHPDSFETDLMIEDIKKLKNGEAVECPVYDYTIPNRSSETVTIAPRSIILIEGILIFSDIRLCNLMDIKIFVDTDADIRLIRRIRRDMETRNRTTAHLNRCSRSIQPPSSRCMTVMWSRAREWLISSCRRAEKMPSLSI